MIISRVTNVMAVKTRILWIGFGNFAKRLHGHVAKRQNVEIVSFYHPDKAKAIERFGAKASWDIERAITDPAITTVFITTPNDRHTKYLKLALANKKSIFVEKPITASLDEALEIGPSARLHKQALMVGHNMRRRSAIRRMKEIIDSGQIGQVVSIYANYSKGIAYSMDPTNWRFREERHREGPLVTVGIHLIDIFHYLLGPVESVSAVIKNISQKTKAPDSNAVLLNFLNGATAFLEANYNTPSESTLNVYGTEGVLYLNRNRLQCRLGRDHDRIASPTKELLLADVDDLAEEIDEFLKAVDGHRQIETGYQEALNALAVIEACFQSNRDRCLIEMRSITKDYFKT